MFPIVGIGASAGGLEATTELLKHIPDRTGMAFVVVQHLDPNRKSALTDLLGKATSLPVREVSDGLAVVPDHVYVIPPGFDMAIERGALRLTERRSAVGGRRSIDSFFESLASDHGAAAIGVVLSGTATDGTVGLEAIKAEGGLTFAQDETAKYPSMPRSAVAAGFADAALSPRRIAEELARIAEHPLARSRGLRPTLDPALPGASSRTAPESREDLDDADPATLDDRRSILGLLRQHTGIDFTLYKPSTVTRRLQRRMMINQMRSLEAYARFVQENPRELGALHDDMLITLTGFFRNPTSFEALKTSVFAKLARTSRERPIRAWVAGCSTGQEAYSVVMAYVEATDGLPHAPKLQVFATDVSQKGVEGARSGLYPQSALGEMSPERIERFFEEEESAWFRVRKSVREMVVFAHHDILRSPPFSHLDLVTCRNLLIYLRADAQRRIFSTFARALDAGGFLFLGASESPGAFPGAFVPVEEKHRIFARTDREVPMDLRRLADPHGTRLDVARATARTSATRDARDAGVQRAADRVLADRHAPNGVVVDADLHVVEIRGHPEPWLKLPVGRATFDVRKLVHDGLAGPLRSALRDAKAGKRAVRREPIRVSHAGRSRSVSLEVVPLRHSGRDYFLVHVGESASAPKPGSRADAAAPGSKGRRGAGATGEARAGERPSRATRCHNADLERDLTEAHDEARTLRQEHDAVVEELSGANEEASSANEELQSLNEEMEAAKEELESANEELSTVNDEMAKQNAILSRTAADLANTERVAALDIVIVDETGALRRFTPSAAAHFSLAAGDLGQPLSSLPGFPAAMHRTVAEALSGRAGRDLEVQDRSRRWLGVRVDPYVGAGGRVQGAVLSFRDIDAQKRREAVVREARDFAEAIIRTVRDGLLVLDADLTVTRANDAFYNLFRTREAEVVGKKVWDLSAGQWNTPVMHNRLDDMVARNSTFDGLEATHEIPGLGRRTFLIGGRSIREPGADLGLILVSIRDITEAVQFQVRERADVTLYRRLFDTSSDGVLIVHAETGEVREGNAAIAAMIGCTTEELLELEISDLRLSASDGPIHIDLRELRERGSLHVERCTLRSRSGEPRRVELRLRLHHDVLAPLVVVNVRDRGPDEEPA